MNRRLRLLLKIFGGTLLGLLFLLVIYPLLDRYIHFAPTRRDFVFIRNSEFEASDFESLAERSKSFDYENTKPIYPVQLHWIKPGRGTIFAIRSYSPGGLFVMDDEVYEKLTVWVSDLKVGVYEIGKDFSQVKAYYNRGGSAWPTGGCRRYLGDGLFEVTALYDGRAEVKVAVKIDCPHTRDGSPRHVDISESYVLKEIGFDEMSPWIGKRSEPVGKSIYSETYR